MNKKVLFAVLGLVILISPALWASGGSKLFDHYTLLLLLLLTTAKGMGFLCEKVGVPELVGELFAGIILGNLSLIGIHTNLTNDIVNSEFMQYAAELSVVLLLFLVGLESSTRELINVGKSATLVAIIGVLLPVLLGTGASYALGLTNSLGTWFIGATLAATSVGITAKILNEGKVLDTASSRVILGAAVIDDVLGILLLAVLAGIATSGSISVMALSMIVGKAILFFAFSFLLGRTLIPRLVWVTSLRESSSFWVVFSLTLALGFAELSALAGLAPIIGAFTGGLLLDDVHFVEGKKLQKKTIEDLLKPITDLLLPIFFVGIGIQVKLSVFKDLKTAGIIFILLVAAFVGKVLAGYVIPKKGFDRLGVGIGMVPRGEVGLIFASYGFSHGILAEKVYSILVVIVLLTTIAGPLALKPRLPKFKTASSAI